MIKETVSSFYGSLKSEFPYNFSRKNDRTFCWSGDCLGKGKLRNKHNHNLTPTGLNPLVIGGYEAFMYLLAVTGIYTIAVNSQDDGTVWSTSNDEESQSSNQSTTDISNCSKTETGCPPCKTVSGKIVPVGTIGYRLDLVPPSKPHYPFEGSHYHFYKANQNTDSCRCFWSKAGMADASNGLPSSDYIMVEDFMQ